MFKKKDKVIIKNNLAEVMRELKFDEDCIKGFCERFVGTKQNIYDIWKDDDTGTKFATVDLCCEIPLQCLEISK